MSALQFLVDYAFLIVLALICWLGFLRGPLLERKRARKILTHFQGASQARGGEVEIKFAWVQFFLTRRSASSGYTNSGSFPQIWTAIDAGVDIDLGNIASKKYLYLRDIPEFHQILILKEVEIFVHSKNVEALEKFCQVLKNSPEAGSAAAQLFKNDISFLRVRNETHMNLKLNVQNKPVLRFTGLPEQMYQQPSLLEPYLQSLVILRPFLASKN